MKDKVLNHKKRILVIKRNLKFLFIIFVTVFITVAFAKYVSDILFDGKNSLKVYTALKEQKQQLKENIKNLQIDNARLQKEYFELKNLEPE